MSYQSSPAFEDAVPASSVPSSQTAPGPPAASHSVVTGEPPVTRSDETVVTQAQPRPVGSLYPPATLKGIDYKGFKEGDVAWEESMGEADCVLELADGLALSGHSFGAQKSIAGECVFQTGMSILSPSEKFRSLTIQVWSDTQNH